MASYPGEDEQLDALKNWWKANGTIVIVGFVAGVAVVLGTRAWFDYRQSTSEAASAELAVLLNEVNVGNDDSIAAKADSFVNEYGNTSQAAFAALIQAGAEVESGKTAEAKASLQRVLDNPRLAGLAPLARLRLARVLLTESAYEEAMKLLSTPDQGAFGAQYEELRGDIHAAQGHIDAAREAYKKAEQLSDTFGASRALRLKLDSLGEGESS